MTDTQFYYRVRTIAEHAMRQKNWVLDVHTRFEYAHEIASRLLISNSKHDSKKGTFTTWVDRATRNYVIDQYRKKKRIELVLWDNFDWHEVATEECTIEDQRQMKNLLDDGLSQIKESMSSVIKGRLELKSYKQIAAERGVSIEKVKYSVFRGKAALRRVLNTEA